MDFELANHRRHRQRNQTANNIWICPRARQLPKLTASASVEFTPSTGRNRDQGEGCVFSLMQTSCELSSSQVGTRRCSNQSGAAFKTSDAAPAGCPGAAAQEKRGKCLHPRRGIGQSPRCKWNTRTLDSESLVVMMANAAVPPGPTREEMATRFMARHYQCMRRVYGQDKWTKPSFERCTGWTSKIADLRRSLPASAKILPREHRVGQIGRRLPSKLCLRQDVSCAPSAYRRSPTSLGASQITSTAFGRGDRRDQRHREMLLPSPERAIAGTRWNLRHQEVLRRITLDVKNGVLYSARYN
ncbi:unnamed protein product [Trichogramma brassicae]|uniref:Uncharacterized protein n=1 Tax=Trichogramma brassicae TaxID=86971 RepID=A0A6H5HVD8_9HYME|nr:unnamed protein product [Trichogramma brassicae]